MKKMNIIDKVALILVVVGGLNWGLVGAFKFNLVEAILGEGILARIIYILVGISAIYSISLFNEAEKKVEDPEKQ